MIEDGAVLLGGIPGVNLSLYRRIRFDVTDPVAFLDIPGQGTTLIVRDIEVGRARQQARADRCAVYEDFEPDGGLSADRETRCAQAGAECLRRAGVSRVRTDRALPMLFAHQCADVGVEVVCDPMMGVLERRAKDEEEIEALRSAQRTTEGAIELACTTIARAKAGADGTLMHEGAVLTSERVRALIDAHLIERGFSNNHASIVAGGPAGHDAHDRGSGPLRTGEPVIIDVFPRDKASLYHGDCTRVVVHGEVPDAVASMHGAILEAKRCAIEACRLGATGDRVHDASVRVMRERGYAMGMHEPGETGAKMVHGTGHGIGLEVHEPPLLDVGGPALVEGDALTVEPGLYDPAIGGLRIEDMVIVTKGEAHNLNTLHEGLGWA